MKNQSEQTPSKVTKVLVDKIHGGRKQDSKFWQSEFSEPKKEPIKHETKKRFNLPETFTLFVLFFIGIGIVSYGGFFMYKRYSAEFANSIQPINKTASYPSAKQKPVKQHAATIDDKPITQKDLDRAIQKALAEQSRKNQRHIPPPTTDFYYLVELVDGVKIQAKSATQNGDHFTIKDRKGLEFSLYRKEIKSVKKVQI